MHKKKIGKIINAIIRKSNRKPKSMISKNFQFKLKNTYTYMKVHKEFLG